MLQQILPLKYGACWYSRAGFLHAGKSKLTQSNPLPFAGKHRILVGRSICAPISQLNVIIGRYRLSGDLLPSDSDPDC